MNTTLQHRTRSAFAAVALLAAQSAHAAGPYYWDGNDGAAGFGTAGGTWAAPTTGTTTAGWSTDSTGATLVNGNSITTATTDALNFGNGATGLAAGTITVSGTVSAGSMTFASGSGAITLGASVSAGTIEFGATTPTITVNNSAGDTINSVIDGTAGFSFSAASAGYTLSLLGANTLTGGITINSGSLRTGAAGLNAATPNALIFNGSATILANIDTAVCSGITINNGSTVTIANNTKTLTCTGPVTGVNDGGIILGQSGQGKDVVNLNSTANTFTGPIQFKDTGGNQVSSLTVNSLADSASLGAGNITLGASAASGTSSHDFYYGSGAIAPLTLNNRRFVLASSQVNQSINNASSQAITINTDLSYTGTGAKTLSLGSTGTGLSTFAGKLVDLGGANTLQIKKTGAGTWALSGANTYIGATTIAASGGTLSLSSIDVVANANPLGQSSAAAGNLLLGNGTTLKYTGGAASTDRAFTINGTSAGHSATLDASGTGAINFTSTTSPAYGTAAQTRTLILTGSNTGANTLAANIGNNTTAAVSLTKNGGGTWVLSGANTYTGATTVSQGTLLVNGSLNASSAVSVASTATLGGSGTINGTVTVSTGGAIQPSTSGIANTLHLANSAAPTYPSGANYGTLKIRASGTALDSVNFSTAAAHSVANLDLHIDCANLSGPVSSVTIYSVASGDMSGTAFHSVTLDNNSAGYSATLHYNATTITVDLTVSAPDTTPPSWISGWPKVDILTPTGFTARAEIDEAGTSYYVVIAGGASAPSAAQVKAGTDASGAAALKSGSLTMAANTENAAAITGLSPSTAYDVWFVAQDAVPNLQASPTVVSTVTQTPDTTPPNPNPMTFAVAPARMSDTTISMTATTATDSQSPPVQYYFENTTNSTNSGWTSSTVWTQTGLTPTQAYSYRVKAMDAVGNPTTWSDAVTVAPLALASGTWNVDQTGIWDATANWITTPVGNVPNGAGNSAFLTFNITAARTVTIDTIPRTLGTLRTGDSDTTHSYTLAATGGATLTFDNGSSHAHLNQSAKSKGDTLDNTLPILLNGSLDIVNTSANALTVAGTITANSAGVMTLSNLGSGAVTLSGNIANGSGTMAILQDGANSTLVLSGAANTFTGDTTVNSGTLQVATAGAFNSIPRAVTVNTGGVLTATADTANAYTNCAISLNGGKVVFGRASGNITAGGNLIVNATSELDSYQANNATTPSFNTTVLASMSLLKVTV